MAEIRFDPIYRHTVVLAPERSKRPKDDFNTSIEKSSKCPFCPGNEDQTPPQNYSNGDNVKNWTIRSFPNKYPAFKHSDKNNIFGIQDVIVESDKHDVNMGDYSLKHFKELLKVYLWYYQVLKKNDKIKYILVFKNHGQMAGATLEHPHSQVVGLSFVPRNIKEAVRRLEKYYNKHNKCYYCSIIDGAKTLFENNSFISISPKDARFSYESWILPKNHQSHFEHITDDQLIDLAEIFSIQIKKMNSILDKPAFNIVLNNGLYDETNSNCFHWNIQLFPRISLPAGFEFATGMFINQAPPEHVFLEFKKNAL
jgi:UDPglucose--hexose-1-phosphate uridylyltransferase